MRMRPKDIVPLADILLKQYSCGRDLRFSAEAKECLLAHCWKGNVRELENCIQRSAILAIGDEVKADALFFEDALELGMETQMEPTEVISKKQLDGDLKAREKQLIVDALEAVNGCRKDAAERLGISPRTLRYKLARLKEQGIAIPAIG